MGKSVYDFVENKCSEEMTCIWENPHRVAMDTSGSTCSRLTTEQESLSILSCSRNIVEKILPNDKEIISWNSTGSIIELSKIKSGGGTVPQSMFPHLESIQSLLVTTDGCFNEVKAVIPLVEKSSIIHVLAIYVGDRKNQPSKLNLPVFAPFMDVPGSFILCHYDGNTLKLLITNNLEENEENKLPKLPSTINDSLSWNDFPDIDPTLLSHIKSSIKQKAMLKPGFIPFKNGEIINIKEFLETVQENDKFCTSKEFNKFLETEMPNLISETDIICGITLRTALKKWRALQILKAERKIQSKTEIIEKNTNIANLYKQAENLQIQLQNGDKSCSDEFSSITKILYEYGIKLQKEYADVRRPIEQLYNYLISCIQPKKILSSYTLKDLSDKIVSNRAKRSKDVSNITIEISNYDFNDSIHVDECDICFLNRTRALLLLTPSDEQIKINTNDFSLNDILSLGLSNKNSIPSCNICIYCASFILRTKKICPYTRQWISAIIPCVKPSEVNTKNLQIELSKTFFDGKLIGLEFQLFLSCLDFIQDRFSNEIINHFENYIVYHCNANFLGLNGNNKKFINALEDILFYSINEFRPESWLIPLRNKSILSMNLLCKLSIKLNDHRYNKVKLEQYNGIMRRNFFKLILTRILSYSKSETLGNLFLKNEISNLFYNTKQTGIPLINSARLLSFDCLSSIFYILFDKIWFKENIENPILNYCKFIHLTINEFLPPILISTFFYETIFGLEKLNFSSFRSESLLIQLNAKNSNFSNAFWGKINLLDQNLFISNLNKIFNKFSKYSSDIIHFQSVGFSPISLLAPVITSCSICGEQFLDKNDLDKSIDEIVFIVKNNRRIHFKNVFGSHNVSDNSINFNVHKGINIVYSYYQNFTLSRQVVIDVIKYLRFYSNGNIHTEYLLHQIVPVVHDFVKKLNQGLSVPSFDDIYNFKKRLQDEIDFIKENNQFFGVNIPSLDDIPVELKNELLAPLSPDELLYVNIDPDFFATPQKQKVPRLCDFIFVYCE